MARALSHPTRVRILMAMNAPSRRLSPKEFEDETGVAIAHASYHFRELEKAGCIALVDRVPRRGATEHYYEPVRTALAWTREWEDLAPAVKQNLAASVLRGGVEAAGRAIDSGSFEARDDAHLSWDTMRLDTPGWERAAGILDRALAELLETAEESERRIEEGGEGFLATFLLALFEAPPKRY
jgi:DNA-binding transcriptional ArsR family regulator